MIEILIVISIIGILAGLLLPTLLKAKTQAVAGDTKARLEALRGALEQYKSQFGDYPPTSLSALGLSPPNDTNLGIESATACLATTLAGHPFIENFKEGCFGNTDNDKASRNVTKWFFGDNALREVVDAWGNPFIYFHFKDYAKPERFCKYRIGDRIQTCKPQKGALGTYHNAYKFQLWSAGPDGVNQDGNEDDIVGW